MLETFLPPLRYAIIYTVVSRVCRHSSEHKSISLWFQFTPPSSTDVLFNNSLCIYCSSAIDQKTKDKVAIKKLYRPFESLIFAKRAYREVRLLRHIQHDNVSCGISSTVRLIGHMLKY